jgi:hypothetical protein
MGKKSADKKRKAAPGSDAAAPAPAAGFSLFGGKKDSELGNVFSASVSGSDAETRRFKESKISRAEWNAD